MITDIEWEAISENDASFDNIFRYAVKTTKIFCRPSCPSRLPKRKNIEVYYNLSEPEKYGYRPCKRCQPTGEKIDNQSWVEQIETILKKNYYLDLNLNELAYLAHGSSSHLRHVFVKVTGQTPGQRLLEIRLENALKELLYSKKSIQQIALDVGLPNVSYFIKKFKERYGNTPKQYMIEYEKN